MSEFTPIPWKITDSNRHGDIYIGSEGSHHFIIVEHGPFTGGDTKATAEFIVRACNSFGELLEACKMAHIIMEKYYMAETMGHEYETIQKLLKDAIAKATK